MSARVLLFVQTGDGRPKCASVFRVNPPRTLAEAQERTAVGTRADTAWGPGMRQWLVECRTADAGRRTINRARRGWPSDNGSRILASGGRS